MTARRHAGNYVAQGMGCVVVQNVIQKGDRQQMLPCDKDWAEGWRLWRALYLLLEKAMAA